MTGINFPHEVIEGYAEAVLFSFSNSNYITRLFNEPIIKEEVERPFSESFYRDVLANQIEGKTEVKTPAGNIDVLSKTQIVEVKTIRNWKGALGQILAYSVYFPAHAKSLHLYGEAPYLKETITTVCAEFGVSVTYVSTQKGVKKLSNFAPLNRDELIDFMNNIVKAYENCKSVNESNFYTNLLSKVEDAILDTYSLEELKSYNSRVRALTESIKHSKAA